MATELELGTEDIALLDERSKDQQRPQEERDMLTAMVKWAKSQTAKGGDWIYSWQKS